MASVGGVGCPQSDHQPGWLLSEGRQPRLYPQMQEAAFLSNKESLCRFRLMLEYVREVTHSPGKRTPGPAPSPFATPTSPGPFWFFHSLPFSL